MALSIEFGNRLESLAERFAARLDAAPLDPFASEIVLVPAAASGRWLQQQLARAHGVAANLQAELAGRFVWRVFCALLPQLPLRSPFEPAVTVWPIYRRLDDARWAGRFEPLQGLAHGGSPRSRYALARQVAALIERYLVDRIDWLDHWQSGERAGHGAMAPHRLAAFARHEPWQAELWRELVAVLPQVSAEHPARAFERALAQALRAGDAHERVSAGFLQRFGEPFPQRVSVFGAGVRAPMHLRLLASLSQLTELTFYVHNPCRQFWQDIVDASTRARIEASEPDVALLFDVGHPLLASWGKAARDALACIDEAVEPHRPHCVEYYADPGTGSRLAALQSAVLDLDPSRMNGAPAHDDGSIQFHCAHTPMRQVEALHDLLLRCFDELPNLCTDQVLVLVPDVDAWAPFITAVFESQPGQRRIPYRIAGRTPLAGEPIEALLGLLALAVAEPTAADLMRLIESPWMARRFRLDQRELERIRHWMLASGMRRGLDESVAAPRQSWRAGVDRLLMGAALDPADQGFADVAARGAPAGAAADTLDALLAVVELVESVARVGRRDRTVARWVALLHALMDRLLEGAPGGASSDFIAVRRVLDALADGARRGAPDARVPFEVLLAALRTELVETVSTAPPDGSVIFAPPGALRGVPHRVIAWLGMDDGAFPRARRAPEWDLLALAPRIGDRMHGIDDRGEFLDSLLAATDRFATFHTSSDPQTNQPLEPSVVISELLEHLRFSWPGTVPDPRAWPLHAYSPRLFDAQEPLTHAAELLEAARAAQRASGPASTRALDVERVRQGSGAGPVRQGQDVEPDRQGSDAESVRQSPAIDSVAAPGSPLASLQFEALVEFFADPARAYARARLGIAMPREREAIPDDARFAPSGLEYSRLVSRALALAADGAAAGDVAEALALDPALPPGAAGLAMARRIAARTSDLQQRVYAYGATRGPIAVDLPLDGTRLQASVDAVRGESLVVVRPGKVRARDVIEAWLRHLLAGAAGADGQGAITTVIEPLDPAQRRLFGPLEQSLARSRLALCVSTCVAGMQHPVALPAETAIAAADGLGERQIAEAFYGSAFRGTPGDSEQPWFRAVFADAVPDLQGEIVPLALRVYEGVSAGRKRSARGRA